MWSIAALMLSFTVMSKTLEMQLTKTCKTPLKNKCLFWSILVYWTEGKN